MMKVGDEARYITSISNGIKIHYSKVLVIDKENKVIELENAMKLKFLHKSGESWSPWSSFRNMANGKNVLVDTDR